MKNRISFCADVSDKFYSISPGEPLAENLLGSSRVQKIGEFEVNLKRTKPLSQKIEADTVKLSLNFIKGGTFYMDTDELHVTLGNRKIANCIFKTHPKAVEVFNLSNFCRKQLHGVGSAIIQYFIERELLTGRNIVLDARSQEHPAGFYHKVGLKAIDADKEALISKEMANTGKTAVDNVFMQSCERTVLFFKDKIKKSPFLPESREKLADFLKKIS